MKENSGKICRFCLKDVNDKYFSKIDQIVREIVNVLYLKIDLDISEDPIMCTDCADNLCKAFKFKSTCIHTEDYLLPYINFETDTKINIQDVYRNINGHENVEGQSVCRFCMNMVPSDCSTLLSELIEDVVVMKNILEEHFPEMDIHLVKEPIICELCLESLNDHLDSITNWINVEEKVQRYIRRAGVYSAGKIDLNNVRQFLETSEVKMEVDFVTDKNEAEQECYKCVQDMVTELKTEDHIEIENLQLTVKNEEIDLKVEKDNNNERFRDTPFTSGDVIQQEGEYILKLNDATQIDATSLTYKCDKCIFHTVYADAYYTHMATHEDQSYVPHSNEDDISHSMHAYYFKSQMINHQSHSEISVYKCNLCTYTTEFENNLEKHRLKHKHNKYKESYKVSGKTDMNVPKEYSIEGYKCENDNKSSEITLHMSEYENYFYKTKIYSQQKPILIHKKPSELKMFKCDHEKCSYQTKRRPDLKKHTLIHKNPSELTMYKCEYKNCLYETKIKSNLKIHMLTHKNPSELTMYKCDYENCLYQTKLKYHLKSHMLIHRNPSESVMYKCEYENCLYETNIKYHLRRHLLIHKNPSELTLYKCDQKNCLYKTKLKSNLKRHVLIHKDPSELTMYKCKYENCLYEAKIKSLLKKHMLVHKNPSELTMYECGHANCSYKTKVKCNLKSHVLIHKNSYSYQV